MASSGSQRPKNPICFEERSFRGSEPPVCFEVSLILAEETKSCGSQKYRRKHGSKSHGSALVGSSNTCCFSPLGIYTIFY